MKIISKFAHKTKFATKINEAFCFEVEISYIRIKEMNKYDVFKENTKTSVSEISAETVALFK